MKNQVLVIHGGHTFKTYKEYLAFLKDFQIDLDDIRKKGWKSSLEEKLGDNFEVIAPRMPNSSNAKYLEWKLWFEKFFPFLKRKVILVGHSLGGIFLTKYLSENIFPKKITGTFLVAAPFDSADAQYGLGGFSLTKKLTKLQEQGGEIYFYHSQDDPIVPFADVEKYRKELPEANFIIFKNREHFGQEKFPELVEQIKNLVGLK